MSRCVGERGFRASVFACFVEFFCNFVGDLVEFALAETLVCVRRKHLAKRTSWIVHGV